MPRRPPRYREIEAALRTRLVSMQPGDPVASETELAEEFTVSRMTARAAVVRLADEGLVVRVPGRGTFVAERRPAAGTVDDPACVDRLAAVLELLAREGVAGTSRVATAVGTSRAAAQDLLEALDRQGLVERLPGSSGYALGLRLLRLGSAAAARFDERTAARPVMEAIHEATEETVYLCVRRGFEAVCIERLDGLWVQSMALRLGGSLPLHLGAAPRALLSYEPRAVWDAYLAHGPLERRTAHTPAAPEQLIAELERVLETGVSISDEDVILGFASIGAPVFDHEGRIRAAVSVGGPRPSILGDRADEVIRHVVDGAAAISRALGHRVA